MTLTTTSMTPTEVREYVTGLIEAAVNQKGEDFVYHKPEDSDICRYLHGDEPGCIVGHVLVAAGVPLASIRNGEGTPPSTILLDLGLDWPDDVRSALYQAQATQDAGHTWGVALRAYKKTLEELKE